MAINQLKFINFVIKFASISVAIGLLLASMSSCGTSSTNGSGDRPPSSPEPLASESPSPSSPSQPFSADSESTPAQSSPSPSSSSAAESTVAVTIYKADDQCANLVSEEVQLPGDRALEAAVGRVINQQSNADFELTGYRVNLSPEGVATVDLRLAPNSQRKIPSLSTCEQFALFGSLRETLTQNDQWNIKSVRFTERGKQIVF